MDPLIIKIATWVAAAILVIGFAVSLKKYFSGMGALSQAQMEEERLFTEAAIAEAHKSKRENAEWGGDAPPAEIPPPLPASAQANTPPPLPPAASIPPVAVPSGPPVASLDAAILRLKALRIIEDREGDLPLSVPPNGVLYRMRRGGTMAILPRVESEASLEHFVKRFEMVVCIAQGGTLLVIERLDSRAVELVDDPGTF